MTEGDNFEARSFSCAPIKKAMIEELLYVVHKLEAHTMLNIPSKIVRCSWCHWDSGKLGIKVDCVDRIVERLTERRELWIIQQSQVWETQLSWLKKAVYNLEYKVT